ncbi:hypothetical protein [Cellvibrio sp. OA-2007]|uniref:hypothetical protein n=1 Tax=Cellvibrio sp. OA-2007 TaxID=529823 RepID=UPI00078370B9|nr:hypothetical protein [Cellvibrio sp. OA-2007]
MIPMIDLTAITINPLQSLVMFLSVALYIYIFIALNRRIKKTEFSDVAKTRARFVRSIAFVILVFSWIWVFYIPFKPEGFSYAWGLATFLSFISAPVIILATAAMNSVKENV